MKKSDLWLGLYILAAVVFLIISIPSSLLDILLAFNMGIALVVLFNALYSKEVLDMSSFPTLLLFTTIFRISLNVSSTKLILKTGDPGDVVVAFGEFVGGGDIVIGVIIFIVLILVQFIVINKGSERVAEVTARFTLDAMPGKQMAIDADLNTGAITDQEAAVRRKKLQQESAFFGSMDGATKYVKGDATAGLIITAINIIGGLIMGVVNHRRMQEASRRRMMQALPEADVVITNPTHFAVALKYEPNEGKAPVVIAKGADYLAKQIKEKAREYQIEIVENKPLARILYNNVEIGAEIPQELYQAVAEVLAFVYALKNK